MKPKKNPGADLERKRPLFFQIGLAVTLCLVFFAFEWGIEPKPIEIPSGTKITAGDMDESFFTERKKEKPQPKKNTTMLKILPDATDGDFDDIDIGDVQTGLNSLEIPDFLTKMDDEKQVKGDDFFILVEDEPMFNGGEEARMKFLADNLVYPTVAKGVGIQGKVYVSFIVEKDGSISNVKLLRGIGGGCDEETLRVVEKMPNWIPGKQRKKPVRVRLQMTVNWVLSK